MYITYYHAQQLAAHVIHKMIFDIVINIVENITTYTCIKV